MKKVLIITYYWPPSGGAGVQRWLKFVKYLPDYGYEPVVLTVKEENASYAQTDRSLLNEVDPKLSVFRTPSFEPYALYLKLSGKKEIPFGGFSNEGSVTILQKVFRFIRGNLFLPDPRRGWNRFAIKKALNLVQKEKFEAVITTGPPHSTHLIGYEIKKKTGLKWIADFRDPWTDIYYYKDLSHTFPAKWYDRRLEKKILLSCDKIITVGNEMKKLFCSKSPELTAGKVEVITNGYDTADFEGFDKTRADRFIITYSGTISSHYRLEGLISALRDIPSEIREKILVRFAGNISSDIIELFNEAGFGSQVEYVGYVPHKESIENLFRASILLLLIPEVKDNKGILTGKFFEYLATGRSILAIGPTDGDVAGILKETGAGFIYNYDDVNGLRDKLIELYTCNHERIGSSAGVVKYSRKNLTGTLVKIIENLN